MARRFTKSGDDNVNFGDVPAVNDLTTMSLSLWVYNDNVTADALIFANALTNVPRMYFYLDDVHSGTSRTDTYRIIIQDSDGDDNDAGEGGASSTGAAVAGQWQHIVVTFSPNSSTGLDMWIDGAQDSAFPQTTVNIDNVGLSNNDIRIGGGWANDQRDGAIAEFAFWNRVLSDGEIVALSKGAAPAFFPSGRVFYAPFLGGNLMDLDGGVAGTNDGSTDETHPPIFYPSAQILQFPTAAGGGGGGGPKHLTLLGVG